MKTYKVVYNNCFGGFGLSKQASLYLNEKYGFNIDTEYGYIDEDVLPRHHKALVEVVELFGEKANGFCAKLRIAEISTPMYRIDEYDGNESVETPDSYNWVIINE